MKLAPVPDTMSSDMQSALAEVVSLFDYEIIYTNDGYEPNFLEVPSGSRVAFRNVSDVPMWTASDPHPAHTDYSVFDARREYSLGETYIFQSPATGSFGFHNHEKSLHRGMLRVIDPDHLLPDIDKARESQRSTRDKLIAMLDKNDSNSIFRVIDTIERSALLSHDCHDMAHDLGHYAYGLFGFSAAMTFDNPNRNGHTSVDDICAGGYMHGILEEAFLNQPELKNNPEALCSSIPQLNRDSCFHGVGHGLMFVSKQSVPESLAGCRRISEIAMQPRCFEGVWMEMFWGETEHAGADSLGWIIDRPLEPCKIASEDEKPACFLMYTSAISARTIKTFPASSLFAQRAVLMKATKDSACAVSA